MIDVIVGLFFTCVVKVLDEKKKRKVVEFYSKHCNRKYEKIKIIFSTSKVSFIRI